VDVDVVVDVVVDEDEVGLSRNPAAGAPSLAPAQAPLPSMPEHVMPLAGLWSLVTTRKIWRWAAGYLASAWVALQVLDLLGSHFAWSPLAFRAAVVTLAGGFAGTLVLAWFHGERGRQRVAGAELLLLVLVVLATLATLGLALPRATPASAAETTPAVAERVAERASLAVLPFTNVGADPTQEYFSDGLSEELIASFAQVPGLRVAARSSSFYFKGRDLPVDDVGRRLHVATVLEGSVRRSGDRVRVTAELVNVATGYPIWSRVFDRKVTEILTVEEDLARAIVDGLNLDGQASKPRAAPTPAAFDHFMRGQYLMRAPGNQTLPQAVREYQAAIAIDPAYAAAWAGLAEAYEFMAFAFVAPGDQVFPPALAAVRRALALDSTSAEAQATFANIERWWPHDRAAAMRAALRALELDPASSTAHETYAWLLLDTHQNEAAVREERRAWELDPFSVGLAQRLALLLLYAGEYDAAYRQSQVALALDSTYSPSVRTMWRIQILRGHAAEVLPRLEGPGPRLDLGVAYGRLGRTADALRVAADMEQTARREWVHPGWIAQIYAAAGDYPRALEWLETADRRGVLWPEVDAMPDFVPLHGQPRYVRLLEKLGVAR